MQHKNIETSTRRHAHTQTSIRSPKDEEQFPGPIGNNEPPVKKWCLNPGPRKEVPCRNDHRV